MSELSVEAGEILFREGDEANEAYVIRSGEVEVLKHAAHGEVLLATLHEGDVIGELALFEQGMPRSATARTKLPTSFDVITREEFEQLLGQCPPRILPVFMMVLDRLRSSNKRVSEKEAASVILESEIERLVFTSQSDPALFDTLDVPIARLPIRIGGYESQLGMDKRHRQNHINIASDKSPPIVSPQHCQVEIHEGGLHVRDMGSRFTTIVNGQQIGRGKGAYNAPLQKGENIIQLGGLESPVIVKIECT